MLKICNRLNLFNLFYYIRMLINNKINNNYYYYYYYYYYNDNTNEDGDGNGYGNGDNYENNYGDD